MADDESGFRALLKPIQDITRNNWEDDLSQYLEEYRLYISRAVGQSLASMNYVEAAYLLQNSVNIFSKKVDVLWTFVIQLLEALGKSKQKQGEENENGETGGEPQSKKKRTPATLSTDDLDFIVAVCSKQSLDLKPKTNPIDPDKKSKIVLNAATKGKPKDGVACLIYDEANEPIGKKEEFRLHWRVLGSGILQEEFINEHKRSRRRETNDDDDDFDDGGNSFMAFDEPPGHNDSVHPVGEQLATLNPADDVPLIPSNPDLNHPSSESLHEDEFPPAAEKREKNENIVHVVDLKKKAWEPSLFDQNMPEKPLRKRKILKQPEAVDDVKEKRKRKICDMDKEANSYLIIDWMIEQYMKSSKVDGDLQDYEFLTLFKAERQLKRQIQLRRRRMYNELVINQAARKQCGDFEGFEEMDPESDDDGGGFQGFVEDHYDDGLVDNVALPDIRMADNDRLQEGSYENEAVRTMQAYQQRNLEYEANELTSLAERVSLWHQLIRPKLELAEKRSAFRIHDYGTRILNQFPGDEGTVIEFGAAVAGLSREEVARNLLSTLCLTNTGNLQLIKTDPRDMAMDCIQLKLLSRVRHHEEMHEKMVESQFS